MNKLGLRKPLINELRDGGSIMVIFPENFLQFCVDKRVRSEPQGRLFINYPLDENSRLASLKEIEEYKGLVEKNKEKMEEWEHKKLMDFYDNSELLKEIEKKYGKK